MDLDIYELRHANKMNQPISIFNTDWILAYGVPKTYIFNCLASQNLVSKFGKIVQIKNGEIKVRNF